MICQYLEEKGIAMGPFIDDFQEKDHMHESFQGQEKVGTLLLRFFKTDQTTKPWFVGESRQGRGK